MSKRWESFIYVCRLPMKLFGSMFCSWCNSPLRYIPVIYLSGCLGLEVGESVGSMTKANHCTGLIF